MIYVPRDHVHSRKQLVYIYSQEWIRYAWSFLAASTPVLWILKMFATFIWWIVKKARGDKMILDLYVMFSDWIATKAKGAKGTPFDELVVLETRETRTSYLLAKTLATMWWFVGESSYILFIGGAMYLTFKAEISVWWIPESEPKKAIGQWSTWTALGLALIAATFLRIVAKPIQEKRKAIFLDDLEMDGGEAHEIALKERRRREEDGQFFRYILANMKYKRLEFWYWWFHTIEASALKKIEDEEREERQGPAKSSGRVRSLG